MYHLITLERVGLKVQTFFRTKIDAANRRDLFFAHYVLSYISNISDSLLGNFNNGLKRLKNDFKKSTTGSPYRQ